MIGKSSKIGLLGCVLVLVLLVFLFGFGVLVLVLFVLRCVLFYVLVFVWALDFLSVFGLCLWSY